MALKAVSGSPKMCTMTSRKGSVAAHAGVKPWTVIGACTRQVRASLQNTYGGEDHG